MATGQCHCTFIILDLPAKLMQIASYVWITLCIAFQLSGHSACLEYIQCDRKL